MHNFWNQIKIKMIFIGFKNQIFPAENEWTFSRI